MKKKVPDPCPQCGQTQLYRYPEEEPTRYECEHCGWESHG